MIPAPAPRFAGLHLDSLGDGSPPLVLVHGFGAHGHFWRRWLPHLVPTHRTHVVDLLGFGRSEAPPDADYSPVGHARRLADLIRELGGEDPVLVGHSLGGGIALLTALLLQDESSGVRPRGLVLVSAAAAVQRLPPFLTLARSPLGNLLAHAPPPRWALRAGLRTVVADPSTIDDEMVEGYRGPLTSVAHRRAILRGARQLDPGDALDLDERLPSLNLPTLLIWGERDRVVPMEAGIRLSRRIPGAGFVSLPGVGHLPPEEAPLASVTPVLGFLDSLERPNESARGGR